MNLKFTFLTFTFCFLCFLSVSQAQNVCVELIPSADVLSSEGAMKKMAGDKQKFWDNGQVISVKFIGGSEFVRAKVRQYAQEWSQYAHISLRFVADNANAQIRIAFEQGKGSWSYLGKDALSIASHLPTMNYGWFNEKTNDREFSRTTLHEFGHALGLIHEHSHPAAPIPWNKEKVYAYYAQQGWNREKVDRSVFRRYNHQITQYSEYDRLSIMHYAVPNEHTIGDYEVPWNTVLSETDKRFIAQIYPKPIKPTTPTTPTKPTKPTKPIKPTPPVPPGPQALRPTSLAWGWYGIPFPSVDAATEYSQGRTYLFYKDKYIQWNYDERTILEPMSLKDWNGVPFDRIDAAFYWEVTQKVYLFRGTQYVRYDVATNKTDAGYPKNIQAMWGGSQMFSSVDAAFRWSGNKIYFFKDNQYLRYDMSTNKVDQGYPRTINATNWRKLSFTKIDAVLKWTYPIVYIFSGGQYHRYNIETDRTF